jgi:hypothetical protein
MADLITIAEDIYVKLSQDIDAEFRSTVKAMVDAEEFNLPGSGFAERVVGLVYEADDALSNAIVSCGERLTPGARISTYAGDEAELVSWPSRDPDESFQKEYRACLSDILVMDVSGESDQKAALEDIIAKIETSIANARAKVAG